MKRMAILISGTSIFIGAYFIPTPSFPRCTGGMALDGCITAPTETPPSVINGLIKNYPNMGPGYMIDLMGKAIDNMTSPPNDDDDTTNSNQNTDDDNNNSSEGDNN
jgi:hypothetical protein